MSLVLGTGKKAVKRVFIINSQLRWGPCDVLALTLVHIPISLDSAYRTYIACLHFWFLCSTIAYSAFTVSADLRNRRVPLLMVL